MLSPDRGRIRLSRRLSGFVCCGVALLLNLSLPTAIAHAQSERDGQQAAAQQLMLEGAQLRTEGTKESLEAAIRKFMEAAPLLHSLGLYNVEVIALAALGMSYDDLDEKVKARDYYEQARALFRSLGDRRGEAAMLHNIGMIYGYFGDNQKALEYLAEALSLRRAVEDRVGEGRTLASIGMAYSDSGDKLKALEYYGQALSASHAADDRVSEGASLNNIGLVYSELGDKQKALEYYGQALPIRRATGDRRGEATTLNNIGLVYSESGEGQKALDNFTQASSIYRAAGDSDGEATALNNIGAVYDDLGDRNKATDYYVQALALRRTMGDRRGEVVSLNNLGLVAGEMDDKENALGYFTRARSLARTVGDRWAEATTLNNIGAVYDKSGDKQKGLEYYSQALSLHRAVGNRAGEGVALNNLGIVYGDLGEKQMSYEYFTQALPLKRAVGDRAGEAGTLGNLAVLDRDRGDLSGAQARVEAVLEIIESLRTKIINQELRASYLATEQGAYEFYIDLLMRRHGQQPQAGYDGLALQVSERRRARSLLELLTEAGTDIRQGVDHDLVAREHSLQERLNAAARRQVQLLGGPYRKEQAEAVAREIESLKTDFQQAQALIRQNSRRYAELTQPRPLTLRDIQTQVLDDDTLLLEYSLGEDHGYLWAVTPTSITSHELPKRSEVEEAARRFHDLLASPGQTLTFGGDDEELSEAASRLSRMLLAPVASQLGRKRLLIVADGLLQYVPFAALPEPGQGGHGSQSGPPLVVGHEIVGLPSASILPTLRSELATRAPAPQLLAVLADPVFSSEDERVKKNSAPGSAVVKDGNAEGALLERLPGSRREAQSIFGLAPPAKAKLALDFSASHALAVSGELKKYRYVHFATHGRADDAHPELAAVILSLVDEHGSPQDGYLRLNEVFNLSLSADLVVLSGCETGLGKEVRGEGLMGLSRGFMYAGAGRVVASLWRVRDEAATEIMTSFYRAMLEEGKRPSEALRAAQTEMIKQKRWQSPRYWAAFVLQGEWR